MKLKRLPNETAQEFTKRCNQLIRANEALQGCSDIPSTRKRLNKKPRRYRLQRYFPGK